MLRYLLSAVAFLLMANVIVVGAEETYVVKKGDNLYKISRKFKVAIGEIRRANNLSSITLKPGRNLTIPAKGVNPEAQRTERGPGQSAKTFRQPSASPKNTLSQANSQKSEAQRHTVRKGETLASISKKYSLSVEDIAALNNIRKSAKLKPGSQLVVKKSSPRTYTVKKGDNIRRIAKKLDITAEELMDINELQSDELKPGQKLLLEAWSEDSDAGDTAITSKADVSEDINSLSASPELQTLTVKERLTLFARKMLDIPYRFGGSTFMGIDCSGYVQKVFGFLDVTLPRTAREQFHLGEPVSRDNLSMGDLVFFRTYASFPSHVGIYLGNNLFIHASSRNRKVSIDSLDTPYYFKRFIGAKRLFNDELGENIDQGERG